MEVHHHSHLASGETHTPGKKWTHYLWEFLMLFLAVFCGFLAENFREHKVEEQRIKGHLYLMVENLKYDTTRIGKNKPFNESCILKTDSIRTTIKEIIAGKINASLLYYHLLNGIDYGGPIFNTAAFSQLKSSGLMRLIKPDSLNTAIGDYYDRKMFIVTSSIDDLVSRIHAISEECRSIIDWMPFHDQFSRISIEFPSGRDTLIDGLLRDIKEQKYNLTLVNGSKTALIKLYNDFTALENLYKDVVARMGFFNREAVILMQQIKQAYHIK